MHDCESNKGAFLVRIFWLLFTHGAWSDKNTVAINVNEGVG